MLLIAWIAGEGDPGWQTFDVWLAFEFPPLISNDPRENGSLLPAGTYSIVDSINPEFPLAAEVKDGDSTDGTPIILAKQDHTKQQNVRNQYAFYLFSSFRVLNVPCTQWKVTFTPETKHYSFQNVASESLAQTNWPPISSQTLIGSRSPAVLGTTSTWTVTTDRDGTFT